jgi:hypothetical protein
MRGWTEDDMAYDYSSHVTLAHAKEALEDLFATGEVLEGERPYIDARYSEHSHKTRYVIVVGYDED